MSPLELQRHFRRWLLIGWASVVVLVVCVVGAVFCVVAMTRYGAPWVGWVSLVMVLAGGVPAAWTLWRAWRDAPGMVTLAQAMYAARALQLAQDRPCETAADMADVMLEVSRETETK